MASKTDQGLALLYDDVVITLSTLGAATAVTATSKIDNSRENGFRVIKTQYWVDWFGKTAVEGPLMVGIAFGVNASEIAETISDDPQSRLKDFNDAETRRPVFPLVMIPTASTDAGGVTPSQGAFPMSEITLRWSAPEGSSVLWFAFNAGGGALTTGAGVAIFAKHFGVWLND